MIRGTVVRGTRTFHAIQDSKGAVEYSHAVAGVNHRANKAISASFVPSFNIFDSMMVVMAKVIADDFKLEALELDEHLNAYVLSVFDAAVSDHKMSAAA